MSEATYRKLPSGFWPTLVIQDRYSGVYAGGAWIAVADYEHRSPEWGKSRIAWVLDRAHGCDGDAMDFPEVSAPHWWVAVGDTPNAALDALLRQHFTHTNGMTPEQAASCERLAALPSPEREP